MFTSQNVKNMRYDELKPACVTFIMAESSGFGKEYEKHRLTVYDETTGKKYFDILDSYLVFVPNVIKSNKDKSGDLYIFSSFFTVNSQNDADEFERVYGAKLLGKELIRLYAAAVRNKKRLLGVRQYNYYFTEKEYERVKLEDDNKHTKEIKKLRQDAESLLQEAEKRRQEAEKRRQDAERQRQEAEKQAKTQQLEIALNFIESGTDIAIVSKNTGIPIPDIENFIADKKKDNSQPIEK